MSASTHCIDLTFLSPPTPTAPTSILLPLEIPPSMMIYNASIFLLLSFVSFLVLGTPLKCPSYPELETVIYWGTLPNAEYGIQFSVVLYSSVVIWILNV